MADIRRRETFAAAKALGIQNLQCWELEDYPLRATPELESRLVEELRRFRPDILLSHDRFDILNPDHNQVSELVFRCSVISNSAGVQVGDTAAMPYRAMTNIINFIQAMDEVVPGFASSETLLYSPELKFYSNRVKMDEDFNTNIQGLYCLGDSSGWTRGLMMASAMGVLMGRRLAAAEG